jgi:hypothetical protein
MTDTDNATHDDGLFPLDTHDADAELEHALLERQRELAHQLDEIDRRYAAEREPVADAIIDVCDRLSALLNAGRRIPRRHPGFVTHTFEADKVRTTAPTSHDTANMQVRGV